MVATIHLTSPTNTNACTYLIDWVRSEEENFVWAATSFSFPLEKGVIASHVQASLDTKPIRKIFTATYENIPIGHIELERINEWNQSATICRVLINPNMRGKGLGTLMMAELVQKSFADLGLSRLELFVFSSNTAAIRSYQKAGFIEEGHLHKWMRHQDRFLDAKIMSALKSNR